MAASSARVCLSSRSTVLLLYRHILQSCSRIPSATHREKAFQETYQKFRANRAETDAKAIASLIDVARSKLSYLRISTPRSQRGQVGSVHFVISNDGKDVLSRRSKSRGTAISNWGEGNPDPDCVRRHEALIERQRFRGPHWE